MGSKYSFYPKESKIEDFLQFPKLAVVKDEELYAAEEERSTKTEEYIEFVKEIREILRPFKSEISEFYLERFVFPDRIVVLNPFFGCESPKEYLKNMKEISEEQIKVSILYDYLTFEANTGYSEELLNKSKEIVKEKNDILECIKAFKIDGEVKWKLFCIYEDPVKYMKKYINLMGKMLPIFESIYVKYEEEILKHGEELVKRLNNMDGKGLTRITNNIINEETFEADNINFIVSIVLAYSAVFFPCSKKSYLVWGMNMTQYFEEMKILSESELNERVTVFKNLGDKVRYETLRLIFNGVTSTKEIAETLGLTSATISYHINSLISAKLVKIGKINSKSAYICDDKYLTKSIKGLANDFDIKGDEINKILL